MSQLLPPILADKAAAVVATNREAERTVATAESCTGGLVAAALTEIPGSSDVLLSGAVTYSNDAKVAMLGVPPALLESHGAVSSEVAEAMASGARERSGADVAVSITGIAGPSGGSAEKPVGTVWFACADARGVTSRRELFDASAGRASVRLQAALAALDLLLP
ncbi:CinA family protein [Sphingomicrobium nitratireducens]|uniref:CinA family protein n=1 Tax=Sphingomicrobium nitratireducens TaxID=2964666 RepID=UPI00223F2163|nr:nicotinamide-nucleotide amidohydrolase family protein [Sphingomicrobium nitratireducens]